ncbi:MAG: hypothetical protein B6U89_06635 [Desulfurococcales archaeon ex4484_58]|nr:MAG: hypothetical protein B6U89_06635 [Desulfurococcales archaeon ex4484_58]
MRSIALTPDISRYLINLARVREGEILLDPFVGTGSILLEAGLMGIRGVGVDIDKELVEGSKKNLESYNLRNQLLIIGDSTSLTYHRVDGIATDPPYGRGASTHGLDLKRIYDLFIGNASESVKDRGYIIFMSPLHMEEYVKKIICEYGLIIRGIHYMYVHGGLTRVIYEVFKP